MCIYNYVDINVSMYIEFSVPSNYSCSLKLSVFLIIVLRIFSDFFPVCI